MDSGRVTPSRVTRSQHKQLQSENENSSRSNTPLSTLNSETSPKETNVRRMMRRLSTSTPSKKKKEGTPEISTPTRRITRRNSTTALEIEVQKPVRTPKFPTLTEEETSSEKSKNSEGSRRKSTSPRLRSQAENKMSASSSRNTRSALKTEVEAKSKAKTPKNKDSLLQKTKKYDNNEDESEIEIVNLASDEDSSQSTIINVKTDKNAIKDAEKTDVVEKAESIANDENPLNIVEAENQQPVKNKVYGEEDTDTTDDNDDTLKAENSKTTEKSSSEVINKQKKEEEEGKKLKTNEEVIEMIEIDNIKIEIEDMKIIKNNSIDDKDIDSKNKSIKENALELNNTKISDDNENLDPNAEVDIVQLLNESFSELNVSKSNNDEVENITDNMIIMDGSMEENLNDTKVENKNKNNLEASNIEVLEGDLKKNQSFSKENDINIRNINFKLNDMQKSLNLSKSDSPNNMSSEQIFQSTTPGNNIRKLKVMVTDVSTSRASTPDYNIKETFASKDLSSNTKTKESTTPNQKIKAVLADKSLSSNTKSNESTTPILADKSLSSNSKTKESTTPNQKIKAVLTDKSFSNEPTTPDQKTKAVLTDKSFSKESTIPNKKTKALLADKSFSKEPTTPDQKTKAVLTEKSLSSNTKSKESTTPNQETKTVLANKSFSKEPTTPDQKAKAVLADKSLSSNTKSKESTTPNQKTKTVLADKSFSKEPTTPDQKTKAVLADKSFSKEPTTPNQKTKEGLVHKSSSPNTKTNEHRNSVTFDNSNVNDIEKRVYPKTPSLLKSKSYIEVDSSKEDIEAKKQVSYEQLPLLEVTPIKSRLLDNLQSSTPIVEGTNKVIQSKDELKESDLAIEKSIHLDSTADKSSGTSLDEMRKEKNYPKKPTLNNSEDSTEDSSKSITNFAQSWTQCVKVKVGNNSKIDTIAESEPLEVKYDVKIEDISMDKNSSQLHLQLLSDDESANNSNEESNDTNLTEDESDGENIKNQFVEDEAMDAGEDYCSGDSMDAEERREMEENEIIAEGESIGSTDTVEDESEDDDEKLSFIATSSESDKQDLDEDDSDDSDDSEEDVMLQVSDEEDDNDVVDIKKPIKKKLSRVIASSSDSESETESKSSFETNKYVGKYEKDEIVLNSTGKSSNSSDLSESALDLCKEPKTDHNLDENAIKELNESRKKILKDMNKSDRFNKSFFDNEAPVECSSDITDDINKSSNLSDAQNEGEVSDEKQTKKKNQTDDSEEISINSVSIKKSSNNQLTSSSNDKESVQKSSPDSKSEKLAELNLNVSLKSTQKSNKTDLVQEDVIYTNDEEVQINRSQESMDIDEDYISSRNEEGGNINSSQKKSNSHEQGDGTSENNLTVDGECKKKHHSKRKSSNKSDNDFQNDQSFNAINDKSSKKSSTHKQHKQNIDSDVENAKEYPIKTININVSRKKSKKTNQDGFPFSFDEPVQLLSNSSKEVHKIYENTVTDDIEVTEGKSERLSNKKMKRRSKDITTHRDNEVEHKSRKSLFNKEDNINNEVEHMSSDEKETKSKSRSRRKSISNKDKEDPEVSDEEYNSQSLQKSHSKKEKNKKNRVSSDEEDVKHKSLSLKRSISSKKNSCRDEEDRVCIDDNVEYKSHSLQKSFSKKEKHDKIEKDRICSDESDAKNKSRTLRKSMSTREKPNSNQEDRIFNDVKEINKSQSLRKSLSNEVKHNRNEGDPKLSNELESKHEDDIMFSVPEGSEYEDDTKFSNESVCEDDAKFSAEEDSEHEDDAKFSAEEDSEHKDDYKFNDKESEYGTRSLRKSISYKEKNNQIEKDHTSIDDDETSNILQLLQEEDKVYSEEEHARETQHLKKLKSKRHEKSISKEDSISEQKKELNLSSQRYSISIEKNKKKNKSISSYNVDVEDKYQICSLRKSLSGKEKISKKYLSANNDIESQYKSESSQKTISHKEINENIENTIQNENSDSSLNERIDAETQRYSLHRQQNDGKIENEAELNSVSKRKSLKKTKNDVDKNNSSLAENLNSSKRKSLSFKESKLQSSEKNKSHRNSLLKRQENIKSGDLVVSPTHAETDFVTSQAINDNESSAEEHEENNSFKNLSYENVEKLNERNGADSSDEDEAVRINISVNKLVKNKYSLSERNKASTSSTSSESENNHLTSDMMNQSQKLYNKKSVNTKSKIQSRTFADSKKSNFASGLGDFTTSSSDEDEIQLKTKTKPRSRLCTSFVDFNRKSNENYNSKLHTSCTINTFGVGQSKTQTKETVDQKIEEYSHIPIQATEPHSDEFHSAEDFDFTQGLENDVDSRRLTLAPTGQSVTAQSLKAAGQSFIEKPSVDEKEARKDKSTKRKRLTQSFCSAGSLDTTGFELRHINKKAKILDNDDLGVDKIFEVASAVQEEGILESKKNKHKVSPEKSVVSEVSKKATVDAVSNPIESKKELKRKAKLAIEQALKASADIITKMSKKKKKEQKLVDANELEPKHVHEQVPEDPTAEVQCPTATVSKSEYKAQTSSNEVHKLKSAAGEVIETPITPKKPKKNHITTINLPTGIMCVEPSTPCRNTLVNGFRESPITPQIGFKVQRDYVNVSPITSRKSRKRKRYVEEPKHSLPKPQWSKSGEFLEEEISTVEIAKLKKPKKVDTLLLSKESALNFKNNALFRKNIHRESSQTLLRRKERNK